MKTDDLIKQLSQDLKPAPKAMRAGLFAVSGVAIGLLVVIGSLGLYSVRSNFLECCKDPRFLVDLLLSSFLLGGGLWMVAKLRSPTFQVQSWQWVSFAVVFGLDLSLHLLQVWSSDKYAIAAGLDSQGFSCSAVALQTAIVPMALYIWQSKSGASVFPKQSGIFAAMAAWGAGSLMICAHCPVESSLHILIWHLMLPGILLIAVGAGLGQKFLKW
jgi:hypothetical protein